MLSSGYAEPLKPVRRSRRQSLIGAVSRAFSNRSPPSVSWKRPHFRLCHLQKDAPDDEYGFTICPCEANSNGCHIISKIKPSTAASKSGLFIHDRLIEVNGCNVENENASQIESRIRSGLVIAGCCEGATTARRACSAGRSRELSFSSNSSSPQRTRRISLDTRTNALSSACEAEPSKGAIDDGLSSSDSGLVADCQSNSATTSVDNRGNNVNECLLLVLDPKSYTLYNCNRSIFLASAPVVFMKPTAHVISHQLTDENGRRESSSVEPEELRIIDEGINDSDIVKSESMLLSSSNDSFEILESKIEASNGTDIQEDDDLDRGILTLDDETECLEHLRVNSAIVGRLDSSSASEDQMQLPYEEELSPRLCYLKKRSASSGFGFHLISPRNSRIQIISKVDDNSPASIAGLLDNDIVIEVNGVNVLNENHREVVTRITEGLIRNGQRYKDEVVLLVVSAEAKDFYDKKGIPINYRLPNILVIGNSNARCDSPENECNLRHSGQDTACESSPYVLSRLPNYSKSISSMPPSTPQICKTSIEVRLETPSHDVGTKKSLVDHRIQSIESRNIQNKEPAANGEMPVKPDQPAAKKEPKTADKSGSHGLGFSNMSVAQMRELLRQRGGKQSIIDKCNKMTLREKYQIVQNM